MKVWLITGVSTGLGRAIAHAAHAAGDRVVGTLRDEEQRKAFASSTGSVGVILDVTDTAEIQPAVDRIERDVGPIDVLVNNAGYGHEGTFEESTLEDLRRQFEVNVFGAVAVTKAVLPKMRERRSGHIVNITSMGGIITLPGLSFYHGSKFALEGLSEALGKEVKDFGIRVTAVEPGSFRTDWAGRSMNRAPRTIADYDALMNPGRARRQAMSGKQIGNPTKLGEAVVKLVNSDTPPAQGGLPSTDPPDWNPDSRLQWARSPTPPRAALGQKALQSDRDEPRAVEGFPRREPFEHEHENPAVLNQVSVTRMVNAAGAFVAGDAAPGPEVSVPSLAIERPARRRREDIPECFR